jgi:hypothetical protein
MSRTLRSDRRRKQGRADQIEAPSGPAAWDLRDARQDLRAYGSGVGVPGPADDQRVSIAVRICRRVRPWSDIVITSRVIPTQTPQPKPCGSRTTWPSARDDRT